MPVKAVGLNSTRMQRAHKYNNIETAKLDSFIRQLERQSRYEKKCKEEEARLVEYTLDTIKESSGLSPQCQDLRKEDQKRFEEKARRIKSAPARSQKTEEVKPRPFSSAKAFHLNDIVDKPKDVVVKRGWTAASVSSDEDFDEDDDSDDDDEKKLLSRPKASPNMLTNTAQAETTAHVAENKVIRPRAQTGKTKSSYLTPSQAYLMTQVKSNQRLVRCQRLLEIERIKQKSLQDRIQEFRHLYTIKIITTSE